MACSLPPERILLPSANPIGTGKSKLMLFYILHLMVYSLATALLMVSCLSGGRPTDNGSSSTHPQMMRATISLFRALRFSTFGTQL